MGTKVLKIYSPVIYPRLAYVTDIIFNTVLGLDFELTTDRRKIGGNPAILYTDEKVIGHFVIKPAGLLSSQGIESSVPEVHRIGDMPVLFFPGKNLFRSIFFQPLSSCSAGMKSINLLCLIRTGGLPEKLPLLTVKVS